MPIVASPGLRIIVVPAVVTFSRSDCMIRHHAVPSSGSQISNHRTIAHRVDHCTSVFVQAYPGLNNLRLTFVKKGLIGQRPPRIYLSEAAWTKASNRAPVDSPTTPNKPHCLLCLDPNLTSLAPDTWQPSWSHCTTISQSCAASVERCLHCPRHPPRV